MTPLGLLTIYCLLILLASLAGGWVPMIVRLTHERMELAVSFVAGVMLGIGALHLLPDALKEARKANISDRHVMLSLLAGFLAMFFVERFFCFHHHDVPGSSEEMKNEMTKNDQHSYGQHHQHNTHELTWSGAAFGLTLHSIIGGISLAASIQTEWDDFATWAGFGVFLVVILHKPFDSLTLGTLMAMGGWSKRWRHWVNAIFALAIPLGACLFYLAAGVSYQGQHELLAYALSFSAGTFLCIAMSDLLPELQFHQHDRIKLSAATLVGLAIAGFVR